MPLLAWNEKLPKAENDRVLQGILSLLQGRCSRHSFGTISDCSGPIARGHLSPDSLVRAGVGHPTKFLAYRQIGGLFEKSQDLDLGIDKKGVALSKWLESEAKCSESNGLFRALHQGGFQFRPVVDGVFYAASLKIADVLGEVPPISDLKLRFGPGATTSLTRRKASPRYKLGDTKSCSEGLLNVLSDVRESMPLWMYSEDGTPLPVTVSPSKIAFVPKSAKTDRAIAVEPSLNVMVQLGFGDVISDRLRRRTGIDIRDQGRNQALAREGSITGDLATLDLSSASDLISVGLVKSLLPDEWFDALDNCRSRRALLDGEIVELSKFCSMGNGFTFPLETVIFYCLMRAAAEAMGFEKGRLHKVSAYGDDIIVPCDSRSHFDFYKEILVAAGFQLNTEKSFFEGPFRESCGKDYFRGIDVRPLFIKDRLTYSDIFRCHNYYRRNLDDEVADFLLSVVPDPLRIYGPDGYGDGHLIVKDPLAFAKAHMRKRGWGGYTFETFSLKGRKSFRPSPGDYVYPSYCVYISEGKSENPHVSRGVDFAVDLPGTRGYKRIKIYTLSL